MNGEERIMVTFLASGILLFQLLISGQEAPSQSSSQSPAPVEAEADQPESAVTPPITLIGKEAPELILSDISGKSFDLSSLSDQIVVMEWTLPECRFNRRIYAQHKMIPMMRRWGKQGVKWVSVNSAFFAHPVKVQPWIDKYKIQNPYLFDTSGHCAEAFGVKNSPTYLVLDRGKIVYHGALDDDVWGSKADRKHYLDQAIGQVVEGVPVTHPLTRTYGMEIRTRRTEDLRRAALEKMRKEALEREANPGTPPAEEESSEEEGRQ
jgi:hypothetical protein